MDPFIGEIRIFTGSFAPRGWALCNGQVMSIRQNATLYSILGTSFGGDGMTNFQLPNLQSRVPLHPGQGAGLSPYSLGQGGGVESVWLTEDQMAPHVHGAAAPVNSSEGDTPTPAGSYLSNSGNSQYSSESTPGQSSAPAKTTAVGETGPHSNLQPYLCVNFIIALEGIYPERP